MMGRSPGKWIKALLLGKKSSRSSSIEKSPKSERKNRENHRWRFGNQHLLQSNGVTFILEPHSFSTKEKDGHWTVVDPEPTLTLAPANQDLDTCPHFVEDKEDFSLIEEVSEACSVETVPKVGENMMTTMVLEQSAIKIQTAFRVYLAQSALRALKGLVRLQAFMRGHLVRRQAGTTLRCVQALVRVQARVWARRIRLSEEGQAIQQKIQLTRQQTPLPRKPVGRWDSSNMTVEELEARLQSRKEAAAKRERALAYAFSRQLWRSAKKRNSLVINGELDGDSNWGWSWLERWMVARPWETADSGEEDHFPQDGDDYNNINNNNNGLTSRSEMQVRPEIVAAVGGNLDMRGPLEHFHGSIFGSHFDALEDGDRQWCGLESQLMPRLGLLEAPNLDMWSPLKPLHGAACGAPFDALEDGDMRQCELESHLMPTRDPSEPVQGLLEPLFVAVFGPPSDTCESGDEGRGCHSMSSMSMSISNTLHGTEVDEAEAEAGKEVGVSARDPSLRHLSPSRGFMDIPTTEGLTPESNDIHEHNSSSKHCGKGVKSGGGGMTRRSFSGPIRDLCLDHGSLAMPSYMATTRSSKAKTRSSSNPKARPEGQERTSPSSRRASSPAKAKKMPTLRSSSTKGLSNRFVPSS